MTDHGRHPDHPIQSLPQSFRDESIALQQAGIHCWENLRDLSDQRLSSLVRVGRCSARNLHRLRGMARLVCDLDLPAQDAALLMHAGIASREALAGCTPERLVRQTGRLERTLGTARPAVVDLRVAQRWIRLARQTTN